MDALGAGFGQLVGEGRCRCRCARGFGGAGAGGGCCAGEDALFVGGDAVVVGGGGALGRCHGEVFEETLCCRWDLESDFTGGLSQMLRLSYGGVFCSKLERKPCLRVDSRLASLALMLEDVEEQLGVIMR